MIFAREDIVFLCFMFIWSLLPDTDAAYSQKRYLTSCKSYFRAYAKDFEAGWWNLMEKTIMCICWLPIHRKIAVSHLVNSLKGVSSRLIRKGISLNQAKTMGQIFVVAKLFCRQLRRSLSALKQYIESQRAPN